MGAQGGRTTRPKQPQDRKRKKTPTVDIKKWKKQGKSTTQELEVPSGNICLVDRQMLDSMLSAGKIPSMLVGLVQKAIESNEEFDVMTYNWSDEELTGVFQLIDSTIVSHVKEPQVQPVPEDEKDRDPDLLYVDEVDFDDKAFIFQFVIGGTASLAKFRSESPRTVAST